MTVLVTGSGGLLGSTVAARFATTGADVVSTVHSTVPEHAPSFEAEWQVMDVRNRESVERVFERHRPDWVINCAAMTDVDRCETSPDIAFEVNTAGAEHVAAVATAVGATPCQISTDYVFGRNGRSPHNADEEPTPIQTYGQTKAEGERRVRTVADQSLVARVSFLYGRNGVTNERIGVVPWILSETTDGSVPLYTDQYVSPTYANHAAETILELVTAGERGTFHCNNRGCLTPFELGRYVLEAAGRDVDRIEAASLATTDRPASRPRHSCLATERTSQALVRRQPSWQEGVNAFLDDI